MFKKKKKKMHRPLYPAGSASVNEKWCHNQKKQDPEHLSQEPPGGDYQDALDLLHVNCNFGGGKNLIAN